MLGYFPAPIILYLDSSWIPLQPGHGARNHQALEAHVCAQALDAWQAQAPWKQKLYISNRIHGAGIYANIWGILMVNDIYIYILLYLVGGLEHEFYFSIY